MTSGCLQREVTSGELGMTQNFRNAQRTKLLPCETVLYLVVVVLYYVNLNLSALGLFDDTVIVKVGRSR